MPRTKSVAVTRPEILRVRLTRQERAAFDEVADNAGLKMAEWCRMALREVATNKLHLAGSKTRP